MSAIPKKCPAPAVKAGKRGKKPVAGSTISRKRPGDNGRPPSVYGSSTVNRRKRRTRSEIATLETAILDEIARQSPVTLRQLFYLLVARLVIEKLEREYKAVGRITKAMRASGALSYDDITDNTRWARRPTTHESLAECLAQTAEHYRRTLWSAQPVYVEIWCEKDALSGSLLPVTAEWDVPLMVCRGFASLSFLHGAAEYMKTVGKPTFVYYIGDHDPSGRSIAENVERRLREFVGKGVDLNFEQIAVTPQQIERWELPTRPTKKTDSRAKTFKGESVEADAIAPDVLRGLVRKSIEQHIDKGILDRTRLIEQREREALEELSYDYDEVESED